MIDHDDIDVERISDDSDRASKIEADARQEDINRVLRNIEKAPADFDGIHCVECDQPIPPERLKTGAFRDIYCQEIIEKRRKNQRG